MSFLDEIGDRLVAQGLGAYGTVVLLGSRADVPIGDGPYVLVAETGGTGPARTQNNTATQRPTAQVTTRARTYADARTMAKRAYDALGGANGLFNVTLSGTFYLSVCMRQEPMDLGQDDDNRAVIGFNFDAEKQPS